MSQPTQQRTSTRLTPTQRVIAQRMTESHQVPSFTATRELDITGFMGDRARLREAGNPVPSLNDALVLAVARALRDNPRVNGSYDASGFVINDDVNVGIAVASQDRLLVPVVRGADRLDLLQIGHETSRLAQQVRDGTVQGADLQGATFTISNLGMMGVDHFTAMINTPQAAILAAGRARRVVRFDDGTVSPASVMTVTITADHRIVYGADAARFLGAVDEELSAISLTGGTQ